MSALGLAVGAGPLVGGPLASRAVAPSTRADPDAELVEPLKAGDERACMTLVERYHSALVRLAQSFVPSRAVAEEVAQETWLGVLQGIGRFEGRSSLKTWVFRILVNRAKTRGERESRSVPLSSLDAGAEPGEPAVDPDRFLDAHADRPGAWSVPPRSWAQEPEDRLLSSEARAVIDAAIAELPPAQRQVITLRDVAGVDAAEASAILEVSDGNQRVLLHRARSRVRQALEDYLDGEAG
jgi:RNA polymerase sigma-70 factor (ECF subfamily)